MPGREITVNLRELATLKQRLETAPKLLKQIGAMLQADSRKAFDEQQFGSFVWEKKYGSWRDKYATEGEEAPPFVSVAGIVHDFGEGDRDTPMAETLEDSPALLRSGQLQNSPAWRPVGDDAIELGSVVPYATLHQQGGTSKQAVTQTVKDRLATWLGGKTKRKIELEEKTKSGRYKTKTVTTDNERYRAKLGFLLQPDVTELETEVIQRPFIGITERRSKIIAELLEEFMVGES